MKRLLVVGAALAAVLGCSASEPLPVGTGPTVNLPPEVVAQIQALLAEKAARTPVQRKISSQLLYQRNGLLAPPADLRPLDAPDAQGRVLVDIKHSLGASLETRVADLGGTVTQASASHSSLRAWVPLTRIEELAGDATVLAVRPALQALNRSVSGRMVKPRWASNPDQLEALSDALARARDGQAPGIHYQAAAPELDAVTSVGAVSSAGDIAHGANRARKQFNTDGRGVKVGVLSDSDDFREQSIASGDLPSDVVTLPGQDGRPGAGEGTAMMEIVHDLAPGAKLFFATAFNSPESFADNIRALRFVHHCDIIVDDVIYFFESPYEDDIVAQAVEDVIADGALYFSSAGNEGNVADGTSGTWEGDFKSGGLLGSLPDGYLVHDFGEKNVSNRVEVDGGPVILHWSDPGTLDSPASGNDYDLFVLTPDLRQVAVASTDIQDGDDLPFEYLGFLIPAGYRLVVAQHVGAETRALRLANFAELALATHGAVWGHAAAPGAFGVGAVNAALGPGGFSSGPTTQVELFSSDGNRRIFYDRHNLPIKGGVTYASNGGELRKKPDLSAADGVATTLPPGSGLNPFFGTSAAAPHAAAVAALMKSAVPGATPARMRTALLGGALDIEGDGVDLSSGAGVVSAGSSLQLVGARPAVFLEVASAAASGALVPGSIGSLVVTVVNNGGADATNVRGTLSTLTPGVAIVGPDFSLYPAIAAAGGTGTNNTPFALSLSPALPCGALVKLRLSVTFAGAGTSPTVLELNVQTGTPATMAVPISFTGPPAAIPDGSGAGVNLPLVVSGLGSISKVELSFDGSACSAAVGAATVGLDHSWVGDLVVKLTSPAGTTVKLMDRPGGPGNSGNNFCGTVLSDGAASSIQNVAAGQAPYTGTFKPASPLAAFNGQNANGTWVLNASDLAPIDSGSVRAFTLLVTGFACGP
jgi:subtilisin-like proprotein convertase family protein